MTYTQPSLNFSQPSYFNTTELTGKELEQKKYKCTIQDLRILSIMDCGERKTPFMVMEIYNKSFNDIPIGSVRRSLTNLTTAGYLRKILKEEMELKIEKYGAVNHYWEKIK